MRLIRCAVLQKSILLSCAIWLSCNSKTSGGHNLDTKALYYIAEYKSKALLAADMVSTSKAIRFAGILPAIDIVKCIAAEAASLTDLPEDAPPDAYGCLAG